MTVILEMYGLPPAVTQLRQVEVILEENSDLRGLVGKLREKIPSLSGSVISRQEDRLLENYAFIINGQFHLSDSQVRLKPGDHAVLVLLATGG